MTRILIALDESIVAPARGCAPLLKLRGCAP
jgi:hypothetical protein